MGRHGASRRSAHRCSRPASHQAISEVCQQAHNSAVNRRVMPGVALLGGSFLLAPAISEQYRVVHRESAAATFVGIEVG
ncbi:Uncharacterised protein [Yersinia aleksiciae]|uniref:Uncharacterized protein n=1 Tax=Yersinia aleksiciae TaxID=263819 RepID=A0A0T9U0E9_YERAE|nr:Uncharacterised protein [Yersinia aleksiciae]